MLLARHSPTVTTTLRYGVTAVLIGLGLLTIPTWHGTFRVPTVDELAYLLAIAGSTGVVAMYLYYRGLRDVPVYVSAILELTWPVVAIAVDYVAYGTHLFAVQYLASAVLLVAMYQVARLSGERAPASRRETTDDFLGRERENAIDFV